MNRINRQTIFTGIWKGSIIFLFLLPFACENGELTETGMQILEKKEKEKLPVEPMAEYTRENAREWKGMEDEHIPTVQVTDEGGHTYIRAFLTMKSRNASHYIEKMGILDVSGKTLYVRTFGRDPVKYDFKFQVPRDLDLDTTKVFVKCNIHDMWTVSELNRFRVRN